MFLINSTCFYFILIVWNHQCVQTIIHYCSSVSVKPVDRSEMITQLQTNGVLTCHMVMFFTHTSTKMINENQKYLKKNLPNASNPITNNTQNFLRLNPGHIMCHQYFLILQLPVNMRQFPACISCCQQKDRIITWRQLINLSKCGKI
jgi:hypothetical protein